MLESLIKFLTFTSLSKMNGKQISDKTNPGQQPQVFGRAVFLKSIISNSIKPLTQNIKQTLNQDNWIISPQQQHIWKDIFSLMKESTCRQLIFKHLIYFDKMKSQIYLPTYTNLLIIQFRFLSIDNLECITLIKTPKLKNLSINFCFITKIHSLNRLNFQNLSTFSLYSNYNRTPIKLDRMRSSKSLLIHITLWQNSSDQIQSFYVYDNNNDEGFPKMEYKYRQIAFKFNRQKVNYLVKYNKQQQVIIN